MAVPVFGAAIFLIMILKTLFLLAGLTMLGAPKTTELDALIDQWHKDAAAADFKAYFGFMDESFVFIGTAPDERWNKTDFAAFSKPYFDKGKAWDFKSSNRKWAFSKDGKTAWFDEELDTWMRGCRATGVLMLAGKEWKIVHYDLHVLIENEKIDAFLKLRDEEIKK